jgi:hypothetical protein
VTDARGPAFLDRARALSCLGLGGIALIFLGACAHENAAFTTNLSSELLLGTPHAISVFGVFRDGRMNARTWDDLSPKLTEMLGLEPCPAAYSTDLVTSNTALASAIDDYARSYGVTEPLLDKLALAAKGDLVLVFVVADAVRSKVVEPEPESRPSPAPAPGASRRKRSPAPAGAPRSGSAAFEMTLSLFSPKDHAMVGAIHLEYTGASEDEALAKIQAKWKELLPNTSCAGWDFVAQPVDAEALRALPEP